RRARLSSTLKCNHSGCSMLGSTSSTSSPSAPFGDSRKAQMSASVSAAEAYIHGFSATRDRSSRPCLILEVKCCPAVLRRNTARRARASRSARRGPPNAGAAVGCAGRGGPDVCASPGLLGNRFAGCALRHVWWTNLRKIFARTKEPRSSPSATGAVELPPRDAEAAHTQRYREPQRDAEGPTAPTGTDEATSPRRPMHAGATLAHR